MPRQFPDGDLPAALFLQIVAGALQSGVKHLLLPLLLFDPFEAEQNGPDQCAGLFRLIAVVQLRQTVEPLPDQGILPGFDPSRTGVEQRRIGFKHRIAGAAFDRIVPFVLRMRRQQEDAAGLSIESGVSRQQQRTPPGIDIEQFAAAMGVADGGLLLTIRPGVGENQLVHSDAPSGK